MARISVFFAFLLCVVAMTFALPAPNKASATVKKMKVNPGPTLKKTVRQDDTTDGTDDTTEDSADSTETTGDTEDTADDSPDSTDDTTDSVADS